MVNAAIAMEVSWFGDIMDHFVIHLIFIMENCDVHNDVAVFESIRLYEESYALHFSNQVRRRASLKN